MGSFLIVFALIAAIVIDLLTPGRPIPLVYTVAILMTTTRASTRTTVVVSVVVLLANVSINTYQGLSPGLLLLYDGVLAVVCSIATYVSALLENQNREIALKSREAMQQQDLLKAVMDNSEAAIFLKDRDSRILFMNRQTAEAMGTTVEEGTGKTDREIFKDQKVAERMIANDQRIMASGETQLIEELIPVADGVRTFLSSKFPIRDRSGEITGVGGIATDFTERKITQDLIQKSQENLLMAQRVGHVGNFDWNVLTSELYWSEENYRIYGLAPDVVPSIEGYLATIDPEDLTFVQQAMDDAFSRRKPFDIDMRIVRPDGSKGFVHTQAEVTFDAAGQPTRMFGTVQDITERKQAEEAIRESEARLKRAHKVARLGSWEWDVITGDLFWAEGNYSLHGIDPEKEKPSIEAWMAVVDPAEHEYVNQSVADALAGNSLFEIDYTAIRPDNGKRVVINSKADVIRDSAGNAVRMVGTVQDITDRKQMEEVLAFLAKSGGASANDEFFQSLAAFLAEKLEMFYVCIDRLEGDGLMARTVTVYCDGHFEDNVTYALEDTPSGDVVGKSVCCFPASVCQFFPRDQVLQDLRAESYIGVTLWGYTGEPIGLIAVIGRQPLANRLQAEQILKTVAVRAGAELERLEAEKALMASEERFRTMFEEAPLGIALIDSSSGQIQEMNRMFAKIGTGTEDLDASKDRISLSLFEEVGGEAGGQPLANAGRTAGLQKEKRFTRADGTAVWVRMTTAPLQIDDGGVGRSLYMIEDITDRRLLEEQISRSKRLEVAGQIAGQVAHDFNNLLTPMTAYPELIRMELPASHAVLRYLDLIENSALQMAAINEDLLTLSRRGHFNQEPLALNNLVKQALAQMHEPPNTLIVDLDLAPDLLPVKGSAAQLLRVIANLVTNARDAMIDMGELMVKTGNVYLDKDQLGFGRITVGEYVRLQVQDTGCGMSPETIQRIFEPFYTTKVTDRRRGTGLGLSVVQSIVEDHGGLVDVVSRLGIGSTFSLYFPICREAVKVVPGVEVQRGGETILVVDDDALQLEVDRTLLTGLGYTVNAVASGEKAVAYLRDQPVDLVLLDMIMPGGMDGLETYEAIRKLRPAQRVIIVSGYAESDRVKAVQALGAGAFLPKPINLQKLAKAVRDELDGR